MPKTSQTTEKDETQTLPTQGRPGRTRIPFRVFAPWFAISLAIAQLHSFRGSVWTKLLEAPTETVDHDPQEPFLSERNPPLTSVVSRENLAMSVTEIASAPNHQEGANDKNTSNVQSASPKVLPTQHPNKLQAKNKTEIMSATLRALPKHGSTTVTCTHQSYPEGEIPQCCGTWEVNADEWWLHHPDWEIRTENSTHFCFTPMKDQRKASFLTQVHEQQWNGNCSEAERSAEVNSGYGASTRWLLNSFWHAHKDGKPFQIVHNNRVWLYATKNESSWAYCDTKDSQCYWLPISSCSRNETLQGKRHDRRSSGAKKDNEERYWLYYYMTRPKQHFRRKLLDMRQALDMSYPCTTMHVRRGDAGIPNPPFRRYAPVLEYIDAAGIQNGDNVFLMTDDDSTLREINNHLPNYNWIYLDRPRNDGIKGGFDGHVPSGNPGYEMLVIDTELQLAKSCEKIVYGNSGFVKSLIDGLELEGLNITAYYVDTRVSRDEARKFGRGGAAARVQHFLGEIEAFYQQKVARNGAGAQKPLSSHVSLNESHISLNES